MKQYQLTVGGSFQIGSMCIPADPNNADYARMLAEVANGEAEILPVPPPDPLIAWEAEMQRLDAAALNDARYWEELAAGAVSPQATSRMNALIAQRQAHRAARP